MQYSSLILPSDSPADRLHSEKCYDLAIIGAGISSAFTLIQYILILEQQNLTIAGNSKTSDLPTQPVKIIVTEKSGEFWTGMPYGSRSGQSSLLISSLKEFLPQQVEREQFTAWLTTNRESIFNSQVYNRGELSSQWLQSNEAAMSQGLWDDLFIPRYVFGLYLQQHVATILARAASKGLIEYDLVTTEVMDIRHVGGATSLRSRDLYRVDLGATPGDGHFIAKKLVLAIGSPPNIAFARESRTDDVVRDICYIDNMYEPSLDFNIDRICQSLAQQTDDRQVLIVGSNAGTLDTLYSINNSPVAKSLIDKFIVLSPNATFPHRISRDVVEIAYSPQNLLDLVQSKSFTAKQILMAVERDVADATAQNINISDIYADITKVVIQALNLLDVAEQKQFVDRYAVEIGKLQRRAGGEYLDVVDSLKSQHKLELLKGRFVKYLPLATIGLGCEYMDSEDRQQKVFEAPIGVIINCAGFQDVQRSSSVLIQNLIERGICIPNDSRRGFTIDRNFAANKNLYIMGPLVAGNMDGDFRVWHAESCQRILSFSQQLAKVLSQPDLAELSPVITLSDVDPAVLVNAA
jgi:uncharacterized NAD(P)/FAD-binding protein YdhS